jgi:hypothetical protein
MNQRFGTLADGGRLWLAVTAAVPVQRHDLDTERVAGVDLGIIHSYAAVTQDTGLLASGRALRAEGYVHLRDQQPAMPRPPGEYQRPGGAGRGAGEDTGSGFGGPRPAIAAASTRPSIGPPSR